VRATTHRATDREQSAGQDDQRKIDFQQYCLLTRGHDSGKRRRTTKEFKLAPDHALLSSGY
jgi:hypothetical protein